MSRLNATHAFRVIFVVSAFLIYMFLVPEMFNLNLTNGERFFVMFAYFVGLVSGFILAFDDL